MSFTATGTTSSSLDKVGNSISITALNDGAFWYESVLGVSSIVLCDADNIAVDVALQLLVDHKAHWWFASCVFVHFLYAIPLAYCNMFSLLAGCVGS